MWRNPLSSLHWYTSGTFISSYTVAPVYRCQDHAQRVEGKFELRAQRVNVENPTSVYNSRQVFADT